MIVTPTPPETLREALADRYDLQREIGRGGMATVYLATDVKHRREVAVKVLKPELAASLGADRFLREIEIAAQLNHPHILPLLDSAELDGALLYVMPYVAGESLRGLMDREGPLPLERVLMIASEVAGALTYAHRQGVVHRDIKPENILLNDGHAVVADFGIAKALSSLGGRELTRTGFPIGTPGYMSPEQAAGITELDERSDVFSLGAVVYEMLLGDTPRFWLSEEAVRSERLVDAPQQHRTRLDALPREVERALTGALALKQQDRLASPADFIAVMGEHSSGVRRRYRDSEVQDIVKRASEAEARPTDAGLTMGGVQALGAEVGIAPEELTKAARALDHHKPSGLGAALLGTPLYYHVRDNLPGRLEPSEQVDMLNVVREVIGQQGKMTEVMGSLEWRSQGAETVTVTITQRRDDVGVAVMADRSNAAAMSYIFPILVGVVAAVIRVDELQPGIIGTLAILGTGAAAGIAVARTAFVLSGRALRRKIDRLRREAKGYLETGK
jgi:serine/threonine protein kinase